MTASSYLRATFKATEAGLWLVCLLLEVDDFDFRSVRMPDWGMGRPGNLAECEGRGRQERLNQRPQDGRR